MNSFAVMITPSLEVSIVKLPETVPSLETLHTLIECQAIEIVIPSKPDGIQSVMVIDEEGKFVPNHELNQIATAICDWDGIDYIAGNALLLSESDGELIGMPEERAVEIRNLIVKYYYEYVKAHHCQWFYEGEL